MRPFGVEFLGSADYFSAMRPITLWLLLMLLLGCGLPAAAATGRVKKVLPFYLDEKGRDSVTPSLFDRDAYQAFLRNHPDKRSGMRFAIEWKAKGGVWEPLRLKVELRGVAKGNLPKEISLEKTVERPSWWKPWSNLILSGAEFRELGEVTAWRVTLWEGTRLLSEEKSHLW